MAQGPNLKSLFDNSQEVDASELSAAGLWRARMRPGHAWKSLSGPGDPPGLAKGRFLPAQYETWWRKNSCPYSLGPPGPGKNHLARDYGAGQRSGRRILSQLSRFFRRQEWRAAISDGKGRRRRARRGARFFFVDENAFVNKSSRTALFAGQLKGTGLSH